MYHARFLGMYFLGKFFQGIFGEKEMLVIRFCDSLCFFSFGGGGGEGRRGEPNPSKLATVEPCLSVTHDQRSNQLSLLIMGSMQGSKNFTNMHSTLIHLQNSHYYR